MGTLRLILALAVVIAHIHIDKGAQVGGAGAAIVAVKLFFLLSGFYMAMVLEDKYRGHTLAFYKARLMRLMPLYWATIGATLIFYYVTAFASVSGAVFSRVADSERSWLELVVAVFSNLTFIGLDFGKLLCTYNLPGCSSLVSLTVVSQAWTLGIEVIFYLIAPILAFIGWRAVVGSLIVSLGIKVAIIAMGLGATSWGRNFVLAEIVYFMLGMVAFSLYKSLRHSLPDRKYFIPLIPLSAVLLIGYERGFSSLYYVNQKLIDVTLDPLFFVAMTLIVPFLFHATDGRKWDALLGDLSYPIYITHLLSLNGSLMLVDWLGVAGAWPRFSLHLTIVMMVATLSLVAVVWPIEMRRGRRRGLWEESR
jgi:peptidoglycan/LPS O-acetylase OafA/YrhL